MILLELVEAVQKLVGEECEVKSCEVQKNNGVKHHAIYCERKGDVSAASVYVDEYMDKIAEKKMTVKEAAEKVFEVDAANKMLKRHMNVPMLNKDYILSNVEYQVVNRELNEQRINEVPHRDLLDLTALYRIIVSSDENGMASCVINNKILEQTGISMEELDNAATCNTEKVGFEIKSLGEVIERLISIGVLEDSANEDYRELQIYVLSNKREIHGANILLYNSVLGSLADKVDDDLFILPSSIHEVLAVPVKSTSPNNLSAMVKDVNITVVEDEEILSYQVYRYSKTTRELSFA